MVDCFFSLSLSCGIEHFGVFRPNEEEQKKTTDTKEFSVHSECVSAITRKKTWLTKCPMQWAEWWSERERDRVNWNIKWTSIQINWNNTDERNIWCLKWFSNYLWHKICLCLSKNKSKIFALHYINKWMKQAKKQAFCTNMIATIKCKWKYFVVVFLWRV